MSINYTKHEWKDKNDNGAIPITHDRLNEMEKGIKDAIDAVNMIGTNYIRPCNITRVLSTLTPSKGETVSYEAEEDCWISIYAGGATKTSNKRGSSTARLSINDKTIFDTCIDSYSSAMKNYIRTLPCYFAKKGTIISLQRGAGSHDEAACTIYGCY